MDYVILLDEYRGRLGAHQIGVTYSGTLAECRAQTHHAGGAAGFAKSDYETVHVEDKSLIGPSGDPDRGEIARLLPRRERAIGSEAMAEPRAAPRSPRKKPGRHRAGSAS